jgi:glycosyltransferase involved in cell wall biosynthesis
MQRAVSVAVGSDSSGQSQSDVRRPTTVRILIAAPFSPYPLVFGGAIRLYHLVKMCASFADVTLVAYRSWQDTEDPRAHLETICDRVVMVDGAPGQDETRRTRLQLRATFSAKTFQYYSHYSPHFQQILDAELARAQYDVVICEMTQMGYFRYGDGRALRVLDLQNIEHELLLRRARVEQQLPKRIAMEIEARKFQREEIAICQSFDLIFTPSEREAVHMRALLGREAIDALPNSIDPDFFAFRQQIPQEPAIAFIGTTHVDANRDGVCYFMDEMYPLVLAQVPDLQVYIVGGNPPSEIRAYAKLPRVDVTGYVKDVRDYMARVRALIVPLRSGGGTRLKILEGLSYGVPTVSTSIGAEGIDVVDGEHILIGDTPQHFAEQVVRAIRDEQLQHTMSRAGRQLADDVYSWRAVGTTLKRVLDEALAKRQAMVAR